VLWFWCKRTISASFKCAIDYKDQNSDWQRTQVNPNISPKYDFRIHHAGRHYTKTWDNIHYGGLDAWGKTPSTGYARVQIDPQICI
jgi:hypothetical protein